MPLAEPRRLMAGVGCVDTARLGAQLSGSASRLGRTRCVLAVLGGRSARQRARAFNASASFLGRDGPWQFLLRLAKSGLGQGTRGSCGLL